MLNTDQISSIISEFRKLTQKDSISPESLGYILSLLHKAIEDAAAQKTEIPKIPSFRYDSATRALYITY